jgi:hypothetical protein
VTEATRVHSEIETDRIRDAISDYWGEECPEKDADCACCKAWAQLAALERQLADYKAAAESEAHAGDEARAENKLLREACKRALHLVEENNEAIVQMSGSFGLLSDLQAAISGEG